MLDRKTINYLPDFVTKHSDILDKLYGNWYAMISFLLVFNKYIFAKKNN